MARKTQATKVSAVARCAAVVALYDLTGRKGYRIPVLNGTLEVSADEIAQAAADVAGKGCGLDGSSLGLLGTYQDYRHAERSKRGAMRLVWDAEDGSWIVGDVWSVEPGENFRLSAARKAEPLPWLA